MRPGPGPGGATIAYYRDLGLDLVPGTVLLVPCVPGTFDAFLLLLRDYGTMSLEEVLAPAIFYAADGHPLLERASATIATVRDLFLAIGRPRLLSGSITPRRLRPASCFEIPLWPRPIGAWFAKPRSLAVAKRKSSGPEKAGPKALWPKRSTASAARTRS
jgi:hypothetical protein